MKIILSSVLSVFSVVIFLFRCVPPCRRALAWLLVPSSQAMWASWEIFRRVRCTAAGGNAMFFSACPLKL